MKRVSTPTTKCFVCGTKQTVQFLISLRQRTAETVDRLSDNQFFKKDTPVVNQNQNEDLFLQTLTPSFFLQQNRK